ncbi:MAG: Rieske (2Fe-2S) protein [Flavobacteriales bacterium]|jgi:nitrite reductase/ring-hydroxylating ferredoxin subunit|nr:Rieske (2Fe-2S) protein [Flavobacteriales bacterium]
MDRRNFIQNACLACLSATAMPALLASCTSTRYVTATIEGDDLVLPFSAFLDKNGKARPYLIVTQDQLKHPIAVFHAPEGYYHSVLMRCTHRGADLQVVGERLECPAHGSVFESGGAVIEGPASIPLRKFPTVELDGLVRISLGA